MARILEQGDIYFVFRPRVEIDDPHGLGDVQRLFVILSPRGRPIYRRLVVGRKRLPDIPSRERNWAYVDKVTTRTEVIEEDLDEQTYSTRTRGVRWQPAARPAGEGVYALVEHEDHTHLAYTLELPEQPGEVQDDLRIEPEASYIVTMRNPRGRFGPFDPAEFDREGSDLVLIGAGSDLSAELGLLLSAERETAATADLFRDLRLLRERHPTAPLEAGVWD